MASASDNSAEKTGNAGKESWSDVKTRVKGFLDDLKTKNYESVLIVTHGYVITAALVVAGLEGDDIYQARKPVVECCGFIEIEL